MEVINIKTSKREEIIDITHDVENIVKNVKKGIALIYVPHATTAITINENYDPNVCKDFLNFLKKLIPQGVWLHDRIDANGDAHLKAALIGPSEAIPIENGKLLLGTWQSIMFCEFDGPRERKIYVNIIKE